MKYLYKFRLSFFIIFIVHTALCSFSLCGEIEYLTAQVKSRLPHDTNSFTQGLAIYENELYESAGLYGQSSLRHIDLRTGQVLNKIAVSPLVFAEGLAVNDRFIVQTTWKERKIFVYDRATFVLLNILFFDDEGWGLCRDGDFFIMSNGTSKISIYALKDWKKIRDIDVTYKGHHVEYLNDLECVGDSVYVNVWGSNAMVRFNKVSGEVNGIIDASSLLTSDEKKILGKEDVLNGIAYNPITKTFWITGKRWPWLFEVDFVPTK